MEYEEIMRRNKIPPAEVNPGNIPPEVGRKITFLGIQKLTRMGNLYLACIPEGTPGRIVQNGAEDAIRALLFTENGLKIMELRQGEYRVEPDEPWQVCEFKDLKGGESFMPIGSRYLFLKLDREAYVRIGEHLKERNAVYVPEGKLVPIEPEKISFRGADMTGCADHD